MSTPSPASAIPIPVLRPLLLMRRTGTIAASTNQPTFSNAQYPKAGHGVADKTSNRPVRRRHARRSSNQRFLTVRAYRGGSERRNERHDFAVAASAHKTSRQWLTTIAEQLEYRG